MTTMIRNLPSRAFAALLLALCLAATLGVTTAHASAGSITLAAGTGQTCAVQAGVVKCWGSNGDGELGDGTTTDSSTPVAVQGISSATALAAGDWHTCALLSAGTVKCWGFNFDGELGDGATANSSTPVAVQGISNATAISAGSLHSCALLSNGTVKCWGGNNFGQLGVSANGTANPTPVTVQDVSNAIAVSVGRDHACAVLRNGTAQCWGDNASGQLGDGSTTSSATPVSVQGLTDVTAIAAAQNYTCALLSDGGVRCWGGNSRGMLGNGGTTNSSIPVAVQGISSATALAAGYWHTCALLADGTAQCWGSNVDGQLGDGTTTNRTAPVSVPGISGATALAAGKEANITFGAQTCTVDGSAVKCWGRNNFGQLGDGTTTDSLTPVTLYLTPATLSADQTSLDFGSSSVGQSSASQTVTVTDTGDAPLTVGSASLNGASAGKFAITSDTCSGETVGGGDSCTIAVRFDPTAAGAQNAQLSIPSSDPGSPQVVDLSGTGTQAPAPSQPTQPTEPAQPTQPSPAPQPAPVLGVRALPAGGLTVHAGPGGSAAHLNVQLSAPATVTLTVEQRVHGRWVAVGSQSVAAAQAGPLTLTLNSHPSGHSLAPGAYRVVLQAGADGQSSPSMTVPLTVGPPANGPHGRPRMLSVTMNPHTIVWRRHHKNPRLWLTFLLSRSATLRMTLQARIDGRWQRVAVATKHAKAGADRVQLVGRWKGRLVPARRVRLLVKAAAAGQASVTRTLHVTVRHGRA